MKINIPLMSNNISRQDLDVLIEYLKGEEPRLTQGPQVIAFEEEWSKWLGVKYSVFVNSGSSANIITMAALKYMYGEGEVIVPTLTWSSDICAVMYAGLKPVFIDINPQTLAMDENEIFEKITPKTKAVFLTHVLGFNGLTDRLLAKLKEKNILLIEDVCESHGATHNNKRLGSIGHASNFSFYFAHHMSTIEGGMICTNSEEFYDTCRMLRSHGMVRESTLDKTKNFYKNNYPDLNPQFIFSHPGFNMRSTELNAVIGRNQLKQLDEKNLQRVENCYFFYQNLESKKYRTDFIFEGSVNYAFVLVLQEANDQLRDKVQKALDDANVEYRRGTAGGGSQVRQPFVRNLIEDNLWTKFPKVDHIHFYGFYIGNYPGLEKNKIEALVSLLNSI
ncbi:MAG: DegT/DnrJ/EryC1/StrS aminotransferase family protein [Bacteriovoracaceae bacterium]|nr:DegT/DnrJ/EryC1/StrS aminotransferase family protein [Bacteriovoracaceae bacterium]